MSLHRWTGITVSKEQLAEAKARVKAAGLSDRITLMFCDYRYRRLPGPLLRICKPPSRQLCRHPTSTSVASCTA